MASTVDKLQLGHAANSTGAVRTLRTQGTGQCLPRMRSLLRKLPLAMGTTTREFRHESTPTWKPSMALTLAILGSLFCCHVQRVAAGISCRDMSRCNSYADCSDRDAMYRAGHLCVDFPYYTGGPPLTTLHWSTVSKNYNCTVGSPAGCRRRGRWSATTSTSARVPAWTLPVPR